MAQGSEARGLASHSCSYIDKLAGLCSLARALQLCARIKLNGGPSARAAPLAARVYCVS